VHSPSVTSPYSKSKGGFEKPPTPGKCLNRKIYFFGCFFLPKLVSTDDPILVSICFAASA